MTIRRILEAAAEFAARALVIVAVAGLLVLLAFAIANDPSCPAGLSGPVALPWLHEMQAQMCGGNGK